MFRDLGCVELRTGERVGAGVVHAPDEAWAERIEPLLAHKGDPWSWQNSEILRCETGVDARFYVLHRDGKPFANILTAVVNGAGLLGHVWTMPEDRRKGAIALLMPLLLDDFCASGGKALHLGTSYDSTPYHIYRRYGFEAIEPMSGYMTRYTESKAKFEASYFGDGPRETGSVAWCDWPTLPFLFLDDTPTVVRCVPIGIVGRVSSEAGVLPILRNSGHALVLRQQATGAALGFAIRTPDPLWPETVVADVYCRPEEWHHGPALIEALELPSDRQCIAYVDETCRSKIDVLTKAGFRQVTTLENWVMDCAARTGRVNVGLWRRTS